MADNTVELVYDIRSTGTQDTIKGLTTINELFREIKASKQALGDAGISQTIDIKGVDKVNSGFKSLIASNKQLNESLKSMIGQLTQLGQIGQSIVERMNRSFDGMNKNSVQTAQSFRNVTAALAGAGLSVENYTENISQLANRLAYMRGDLEATNAQLKNIEVQFAAGKISGQQYDEQIEKLTVRQSQLKTSINEVSSAMITMNKLYNPALIEEETAAQQAGNVELRTKNELLKNEAIANGAAEGSMQQLAAQLNILKIQYRQLSEEMRESPLGKQMLTEIQETDTQIKRLDATIGNAQRNVGAYGSAWGQMGNIVERMGLRMLANLLIFQAVIELVQEVTTLYQNFERNANVADTVREEMAKTMANNFSEEAATVGALKDEFESLTATEYDRQQVVDELNSKYEKQIGHLNGINDAEAFFRDKSAAFIQALDLRAKAAAALNLVVKEYQTQMEQQSDPEKNLDWFKKIGVVAKTGIDALGNMQAGQSTNLGDQYDFNKIIAAANSADKELGASYKRQSAYQKLLQEATEQANAIDKKNGFKTNADEGKEKAKKEHDYTNARLEAQKKLTEFTAKETEEQIRIQMDGQKQVYDDQNQTLLRRLVAFSDYTNNMQKLAKVQADAEIKVVQDKLDKIAELKKRKPSGLTTEEHTLLLNEDALNAEKGYLQTKYQETSAGITRQSGAGIASMIKTDLQAQLRDLSDDATQKITDIENKALAAQQKLGLSPVDAKKSAQLDRNTSISEDRANLSSTASQREAIQGRLDILKGMQSTNPANISEEKELQSQLVAIDKKAADERVKLNADVKSDKLAQQQQEKEVNKAIADASIEVFQGVTSAYIQGIQEQMDYKNRQMQLEMQWNKKVTDSLAQSKREQENNDKRYMVEQQAMEREQMIQKRKLAEAQMGIDYATGVMKIWAHAGANQVIAGIETAALTAIYGAKLAMVQGQSFAQGGEVPTGSGGMIGGKSHAQGGSKFAFGGRMHEAEAGEMSIINKRSTASSSVLSVVGTPKQIGSAINAYGGGVHFAPGARVRKLAYGGDLGASVQPPSFISDMYLNKAFGGGNTEAINSMMQTLQSHSDALARMDKIQVVLNPHEVINYQKSYQKSVKMGQI
jgi:hypothetical protein